jgi:glycosyltransferase involved in cell wall biosynthesis
MAALGVTEVVSTIVADRTVAVSEATRRRYPWVRTVIPNGVDLARFTPGDKSPEPTVLFVGSYRHRKRGKLLMEVFRDEVRPQVPDAVLLMAAPDAPDAPGVVQLGRPPTDELAEHYRRAWVFCLPSTYEGFGIPYVEAMASGTAVVASPNPGAREVLRNGALGRVVRPAAARSGTPAAGTGRARRSARLRLGPRPRRLRRGLPVSVTPAAMHQSVPAQPRVGGAGRPVPMP